jgi:hypothetical protein
MMELYKDLDTVARINKKRLEWIGHVVRMNQGRTVNKLMRVNRREVQKAKTKNEMAASCRDGSAGDKG